MERKKLSPASMPTTWKASEVIAAFQKHYLDDVYGAIQYQELELQSHDEDEAYCRRADLFIMYAKGIHHSCKWSKHRYPHYQNMKHESSQWRRYPVGWRIGFEVKVTRLDLKNDIKQRWKQNPLIRYTNEAYLLVPRGLLNWKIPYPGAQPSPDLAPPLGMGIIEVFKDARKQWEGSLRAEIMRPSYLHTHPELPHWLIIRMLLARPHRISVGDYPEM